MRKKNFKNSFTNINFHPSKATNQQHPKKNLEEVLTQYMKTSQSNIDALLKNHDESQRNIEASIKNLET